MTDRPLRVVIDTNTLLRGLASEGSSAAKVISAAEARRFVPLLSRPVLHEYRSVLSDPEIIERFPSLSRRRVDLALARLRFIADYFRDPTSRFPYSRDPRDGKFVELAVVSAATHIITSDKDLLSLPIGHGPDSHRFRQQLPGVRVMHAGDFLKSCADQLRLK